MPRSCGVCGEEEARLRRIDLIRAYLPMIEAEALAGREPPAGWRWLDRRMWPFVYQGA